MKIYLIFFFLFIFSFINSASKTKEITKNSNFRKLYLSAFRFKSSILQKINEVRQKHHADNLSWDIKLAEKASNNITEIKENLDKDPYINPGEILYLYNEEKEINIENVVKSWEEEEEYYDYDNPGFKMDASFFTQIVWKNSKKVGCAFSSKKEGKSGEYLNIVVCHFEPRGNVEFKNREKYKTSAFAENVLPIESRTKDSDKEEDEGDDDEEAISYEAFLKRIYEKINFYWKKHNAGKLIQSNYLEEKAYEIAKESAEEHRFPVSKEYGLNLVGSNEGLMSPEEVVEYMYDQKKDFNPETLEIEEEAELFVQLVWKSAEEVGCGLEKDVQNNRYIYICLFDKKMDTDKDEISENVDVAKKKKPKTAYGDIESDEGKKDKGKSNKKYDDDDEEKEEKDDNVILQFTTTVDAIDPYTEYYIGSGNYVPPKVDTNVYVDGIKVGPEFHKISPYNDDVKTDGTDESILKKIVDYTYKKINYYRKLHQVPELKVDAKLEKSAQNYSNYIAETNSYENSEEYKKKLVSEVTLHYEPLCYRYQRCYPEYYAFAADKWYESIKNYDFENLIDKEYAERFTTMVWKGSKKVGCGIARIQEEFATYYMVCQFYPPGNIRWRI